MENKPLEKNWTKSFISISLTQLLIFTVFYYLLNVLMIICIYLSLNVQIFEQTSQGNLKLEHLRMNCSDLIEVKAIPVGIISGLVGFAYASILSFVPVHAEDLGLSSVTSYFFLVFAIVMIAFSSCWIHRSCLWNIATWISNFVYSKHK